MDFLEGYGKLFEKDGFVNLAEFAKKRNIFFFLSHTKRKISLLVFFVLQEMNDFYPPF